MSKILQIFLSNERALKNYLSRFFNRAQDIDDIAQETFLKAFAAEIKTDIRSPKAFLFKIAKHTALHEVGKKANTTTDYIEDFVNSEVLYDRSNVCAEAEMDGKRKLIIFSKAVAHLPPKCRQVFLMRKVDGLQMKEIAGKLNISVSGVEKHVVTGLVKCSQYFREQGYDPEELGPLAVIYSKKNDKNITELTQAKDD